MLENHVQQGPKILHLNRSLKFESDNRKMFTSKFYVLTQRHQPERCRSFRGIHFLLTLSVEFETNRFQEVLCVSLIPRLKLSGTPLRKHIKYYPFIRLTVDQLRFVSLSKFLEHTLYAFVWCHNQSVWKLSCGSDKVALSFIF